MSNHSVKYRRRAFAAFWATSLFLGPTMITHAEIVQIIGASLRVNNPDGPQTVNVTVEFLGDANSLYENELFLDAPNFQGPIFNNKTTPVGFTTGLGSFQPETVLFIRNQAFFVPNPGSPASYNFGFFTGDGTLPPNPDGLPHALFTFDTDDPDAPVTVSFEDQFGGGDLDFNDAVYSFTHVRAGMVDVALSPMMIPMGENVTVEEDHVRYLSAFQDSFNMEGTIDNNGAVFNYGTADNVGMINNHSTLLNDRSGTLHSGGDLENTGTFGNFGDLFNQGVVTNSAGTINNGGLIENEGELINAQGGTFVNFSGGDVDNVGTLTNETGASARNLGTFINQNILNNDGDLQNQDSGMLTNQAGATFSNTGTLTNQENATVQNDGEMNNSGWMENRGGGFGNGKFVNADTAVFSNDGTVVNTGVVENAGGMTNGAFGELVNSGQMVNVLGAVVGNVGEFVNSMAGSVVNAATLWSSGPVQNAGSWTNSGSMQLQPGGDFENTGNFTNTGNGVLQQDTSKFTNKTGAQLINQGDMTIGGVFETVGQVVNDVSARIRNMAQMFIGIGGMFENDGEVNNSGSVEIETGASVQGGGTFTQTLNAITVVDGRLQASSIDVQGGVLAGSGVVEGLLEVGADATISPGNSPGTLRVEGDFTLDGGMLAIELASAALHDVLDVTGSAVFKGGTVDYAFLGTPVDGDQYVWLTAVGGITGFETLSFSFSGAPDGLRFLTEVIGDSIVLRATAVPLPATMWLLLTALTGAGLRFARRRHVAPLH